MARPRRHDPVDVLRGVERAVTLLNRFTIDDPALNLPRAARYLNVPRSTAYRVLRSLEAGGLLVYDRQDRVYRLSLALARLGQVALAGVDLRAVSRPRLRRLGGGTGGAAVLPVGGGRAAAGKAGGGSSSTWWRATRRSSSRFPSARRGRCTPGRPTKCSWRTCRRRPSPMCWPRRSPGLRRERRPIPGSCARSSSVS